LERIIQYLFWDEIRRSEELGKPLNHIHHDILRVDEWLHEVK
jgi:hypothetical protein